MKEKVEAKILELESELSFVRENKLFLPMSTQDELLEYAIKKLKEVLTE
jgi:hypothetical protein